MRHGLLLAPLCLLACSAPARRAAAPPLPDAGLDFSSVAGKRMCREGQAEDPLSLDVTFEANGQVSGRGYFSGATGYEDMRSGRWSTGPKGLHLEMDFTGQDRGAPTRGTRRWDLASPEDLRRFLGDPCPAT